MDASVKGAHARTSKPAEDTNVSSKDRTINNKKVKIINGTLVAEPFKTAAKPKEKDVAAFYGSINRILNPPNAERVTAYKTQFNMVTRTAQSAGTVHKRPVPYSVNAPRNRLAQPDKPQERPNASHYNLESLEVINRTNYRFRTTNQIQQMAIKEGPVESHVGFTNDCIVSEMTKRFHKPLYR